MSQVERTADTDGDSTWERRLGRLLSALDAAGHATMPGSAATLLQSIVEAAARIFSAAAASIALVDESTGTLTFAVAYGAGSEGLPGMRIPLGQGIAGYVATSGQPLAISDVEHDPRFASDFARGTGYVPRSILAMPLQTDDRVVGVIEVLDKRDAPAFGLRDMDLLALFARQAALAIDQARALDDLTGAMILDLRRLLAASGDTLEPDISALECAAQAGQGKDALLALADLFRTLAVLGPAERQLALDVLAAAAAYARRRNPAGWGYRPVRAEGSPAAADLS